MCFVVLNMCEMLVGEEKKRQASDVCAQSFRFHIEKRNRAHHLEFYAVDGAGGC